MFVSVIEIFWPGVRFKCRDVVTHFIIGIEYVISLGGVQVRANNR